MSDNLPLPEPDSFVHCDTGTIKVKVPVFVGETVRAYGDARAAAAVAQEREKWLPVLRSSVDAMDALTRHFTKTPSTLLDSTVLGNAHTAIAETRAAIRAGS